VKQFPIFADWGEGQVAAIVALPERDPDGAVISLAGTGRHNVVGSTFSAQLSQRLAEAGLASVRLDYGGVGDSPGAVPAWSLADVGAAARQARAVLDATMNAVGVDRFVGVGTCYGTRVALSLVSHASCRGTVCLAPPILQHGGVASVGRRPGAMRLMTFVRSHGVLRRLAGPLRRAGRARKPAPTVLGAFAHLDRARIAFLYGAPASDDHHSRRSQEVLDAALASLPPALRQNFEQRMLPWGPLSTFEILAPADQDEVLDVVVPLVRGFLEAGTPLSGAEPVVAAER
jgi:hypothetical protein